MLIGAHVSPAGGPAKAVERGVERDCDAIQIFNQSPRAWRPRVYSADEIAEFRSAMADSPLRGADDPRGLPAQLRLRGPEIRGKSLTALTAALQAGAALGAHCVVLHPGSALEGAPVEPALERAAATIAEALAESETCPLHLEDTAGSGGDARALVRGAGDADRARGRRRAPRRVPGLLPPAGLRLRRADRRGAGGVIDEFDSVVGLDRLGSLHLNDSQTPLRLERRPPRRPRQGLPRPRGLRRVPLRAPLRGAPCPSSSSTAGEEAHRPRAQAAQGRARRPRAAG